MIIPAQIAFTLGWWQGWQLAAQADADQKPIAEVEGEDRNTRNMLRANALELGRSTGPLCEPIDTVAFGHDAPTAHVTVTARDNEVACVNLNGPCTVDMGKRFVEAMQNLRQ